VNAVLRRVGEMVESATTRERGAEETQFARNELPMDDGRVLVYGRDVFAEDETQRLSEQTSHGVAIVSRWVERFGVEEASKLALHGVVQPPTIVTDVSAEALETRNERGEVALSPHAQPGFFVFRGDHMTLTTLLASSAACRVQDPTAAHAVKLAHDLTPGMVIDLCAGRGTKTRQLAAQFPDARIVASDASQERVKVLRQVFAGNERVTVAGPDELGALAAQADLVVCDVPCSNSGVLARRSEAKYRFDAVHLAELVRTQKAILSQAASLLKPGGAVLYATCSIEEEENAAQVKSASSKHGWRGTAEFGAMPAGLPGVDAAPYHDGGYAALLVSTG
jgi:16S rRNA (cytosine967-C5)-methyltransferase